MRSNICSTTPWLFCTKSGQPLWPTGPDENVNYLELTVENPRKFLCPIPCDHLYRLSSPKSDRFCSTVVNLAREVEAPELIPAAFYELCRLLPSVVATGYNDPFDLKCHRLTAGDLVLLLQGREAASRFFSTFIVDELENRRASDICFNRRQRDPAQRRFCTGAFQLITFELLQDVNGLITGRTADPLFAMQEVLNLQADPGTPDARNMFRACDACRQELVVSVHSARNKFWDNLPGWFGVEVTSWG